MLQYLSFPFNTLYTARTTDMRLSFALPALIPAASAAIFQVKVGANNMLAFDPPSVTAAAGDTIAFVFQSKNHVCLMILLL